MDVFLSGVFIQLTAGAETGGESLMRSKLFLGLKYTPCPTQHNY